ncbi:MAG: cardiolipin synthetase [Candidatus Methanolliviera sp. GoM_asphalt]|nr:MAG: cardiolipin synthetase [Candidatus Methanolliviera sp. GoM_asphalt]
MVKPTYDSQKKAISVLMIGVIIGVCVPFSIMPMMASGGDGSIEIRPLGDESDFISIIDGAKESVNVDIYLLFNKDIIEALCRAGERGIPVKVVCQDFNVSTNELKDRLDKNVSLRIVEPIPEKYKCMTYHTKLLLVDENITVCGSHNYTKSAFYSNSEYSLVVNDPSTYRKAYAHFLGDWKKGKDWRTFS